MFNIIHFVMILSCIDLTMTFYQFFIVNKFKLVGYIQEVNPIHSKIIKNNPTPLKYLICGTISQSLLIFVICMTKYDRLFIGLFIGMLVIVNVFHYYNIKMIKKICLKKKKDNNKFWDDFESEKIYD